MDFFDYLVATDELDEFLGYEEPNDNSEENDSNNDLETDSFDEEKEKILKEQE